MIDIDDFKRINDTLGHLAGDKVIIYLARLLAKTLRDGDKVFRYGGEEFVVVLNRIDSDKCMSIAHRLVKLIASSNLIYKENDIRATVSIGGTLLKDGDDTSAVLDRADRALYRAKNSGKNRFEVEI
ncbi:MAG: GGDEF domain-containing protein [Campylobacterota bacterium]|nr:GGDEF domain-containing protein [Campylobacterota bacterium]